MFDRVSLLFQNLLSQKEGTTHLSCFRIAAIVMIALSRMHYLVRRWQLGHHLGSGTVMSRGCSESTLTSTHSLYHGEYTASCYGFYLLRTPFKLYTTL